MNQYDILKKYYNSTEIILTRWEDIEDLAEAKLPIWFRRYIDLFDKSLINGCIRVFSPFDWEEFLRLKEEVKDDISANKNSITSKEIIKEDSIVPFAEMADSQGVLFWLKEDPNKILFMDRRYQIINLNCDFISLILNENDGLKKISCPIDNWVDDFEIETNLTAKYIGFFITHNKADYKKTRECLLKHFPFNFKIKSAPNSQNDIVEILDAKRKDRCIIQTTQYSDTRVGIDIRYPIEHYEKLFDFIREMETLNYYIVRAGNYYA